MATVLKFVNLAGCAFLSLNEPNLSKCNFSIGVKIVFAHIAQFQRAKFVLPDKVNCYG
jgi:hypothetical protein